VLPRSVRTSSDQARQKLDKSLLQRHDQHTGGRVPVFVSVVGDPRGVARQLGGAHVTRTGAASLVIGTVDTDRLVKLASDPAVVSVGQVTFRRDGTPTDVAEHRRPLLTGAARAAAVAAARASDVPFSEAPPAGTQFLARTTFAGPAPHNDLDSLIFGRTVNSYQLADGNDPVFAPYALGTMGASQNTNVHDGVWLFHTAPAGRRS
jgi:hypothetical protein